MAKKPVIEPVKVRCVDCKYCPGEIVNFFVDCSNKYANPGGYKKGSWAHVCKYFEAK